MERRELLLGCGAARVKHLQPGHSVSWSGLVTLDINPDHKPDVVWDLAQLPLPFDDNSFDEVHAYEVLEHIGAQGDWRTFFAQFSEFWRILKPNGLLCASVPSLTSRWAWGDPSHSRVIPPENLVFLHQPEYTKQVGVTSMSDFRFVYKADFDIAFQRDDGNNFWFALHAIKPSRIT
jgi:SAM-dependent methyltransferase